MICEKSFVDFNKAFTVNMADNRSLGGHSQHSSGSFSSIRSNQTLVSAQELFYEGENPEQVSIGTIIPEGSDDMVGRGGFPDTVVIPAINPDTSFTLSTGI